MKLISTVEEAAWTPVKTISSWRLEPLDVQSDQFANDNQNVMERFFHVQLYKIICGSVQVTKRA